MDAMSERPRNAGMLASLATKLGFGRAAHMVVAPPSCMSGLSGSLGDLVTHAYATSRSVSRSPALDYGDLPGLEHAHPGAVPDQDAGDRNRRAPPAEDGRRRRPPAGRP